RATAVEIRASPARERPPAALAFACHFDGQTGVQAQGPADVKLVDCTCGGGDPALWFENSGASGASRGERQLRHVSILTGDGPVFRFDGLAPRVYIDDSVIAAGRGSEFVLISADQPARLVWRGRGNLYGKVRTYLQPRGGEGGRGTIRDWTAWELS